MKTILATLFILCISALPAQAQDVMSVTTPQRVVAIGGAMTEIIYALDAGEKLVGNDTSGYYPEAAAKLPKVGYQRALSVEGILSLSPDLIILTQEAGPPPVIAQLEATGITMLKLKAGRTLADVKANITVIATALAKEDAAATLIANLDAEANQLQSLIAEDTSKPKRVMFILQHGGAAAMVAGKGTAADGIITLSGAENVMAESFGYKPLTPEAAVALNPDVIITTTQGRRQDGGDIDSIITLPSIALTTAGKNKNVIVMDSLLLLGFGPRTPSAALQLHEAYAAF